VPSRSKLSLAETAGCRNGAHRKVKLISVFQAVKQNGRGAAAAAKLEKALKTSKKACFCDTFLFLNLMQLMHDDVLAFQRNWKGVAQELSLTASPHGQEVPVTITDDGNRLI